MSERAHPPKAKKIGDKVKVTLYLSKEAAELYSKGKFNGWDTPAIANKGAEQALTSHAEFLLKKAEDVPA